MGAVLISGANRGLGLEFTRQYLATGIAVTACCRNPAEAAQLQALQCDALTILPLDVRDSEAIASIGELLSAGELVGRKYSIFINNAGVYGPKDPGFEDIEAEVWLEVLRVNTVAPLLLTRAVLPFLEGNKKLIYLSSKMGSITDNAGGGAYIYRSGKTALNQVVKSLSIDLKDQGYSVAALHPGWVQTDMGGPNALLDVKTSVAGMISVIERVGLQNSGSFFNYDGDLIPW